MVTVSGHSMEPRFHTGDLALVREVDQYHKGDVIAFRAEVVPGKPGAYVIHRIVGGDPSTGYVTRGDNNSWNDMWHPTDGKVAGKLLFSAPGAGMWVHWLAQPIHLGAVLAGLTACFTAFGRRKNESDEPEPAEHEEVVPL